MDTSNQVPDEAKLPDSEIAKCVQGTPAYQVTKWDRAIADVATALAAEYYEAEIAKLKKSMDFHSFYANVDGYCSRCGGDAACPEHHYDGYTRGYGVAQADQRATVARAVEAHPEWELMEAAVHVA